MRAAVLLPAMALIIGGLSVSGVAAQQPRSGAELLSVAERSFSDIPFDAPEAPDGLVRIVEGECDLWGECSYRDAAGVGHYFWDGELVNKFVEVAEVGDRPIKALGIGTARSLDDVVARVRGVLPEAAIDCRQYPEDEGVAYDCGATLGEGWITLYFDGARRLVVVRIDARHYT